MSKCQEEVVVQPPPYEDIQFMSHWGCFSFGLYTKMPECVGIRQTGTCLCCLGAAECSLYTAFDVCMESHGIASCLNLTKCKEQGFQEAELCSGAGRGIQCFCCQQKSQYVCKFPKTCCKMAQQECCCDCRCAVPCDDDVPLACGCCGVWIKKPEKMPTGWNGHAAAASGGGAAAASVPPEQEQMNN